MHCRYKTYYHEEFPISRLKLLDFSHLYKEGIKTGGMPKEEFLRLKDDIDKNGLINALIIEVDSGPVYRVAMGNNRVEALQQLGHTHIPAIVIHRCTQPEPEDGGCTLIHDNEILEFMKKIHPGDSLWKLSGWMQYKLKFIAEKTKDWSIIKVA